MPPKDTKVRMSHYISAHLIKQAALDAGALDATRVVASVQNAVAAGRKVEEVLAELKKNQPSLFRRKKPRVVGDIDGVKVFFDEELNYEFFQFRGRKFGIFTDAEERGLSLSIRSEINPFGIQFSINGNDKLIVTNPRTGWSEVVEKYDVRSFREAVRCLCLPRPEKRAA